MNVVIPHSAVAAPLDGYGMMLNERRLKDTRSDVFV